MGSFGGEALSVFADGFPSQSGHACLAQSRKDRQDVDVAMPNNFPTAFDASEARTKNIDGNPLFPLRLSLLARGFVNFPGQDEPGFGR